MIRPAGRPPGPLPARLRPLPRALRPARPRSRRPPRRRHRPRSTPGARQRGNQHGQPQLIVGFALEATGRRLCRWPQERCRGGALMSPPVRTGPGATAGIGCDRRKGSRARAARSGPPPALGGPGTVEAEVIKSRAAKGKARVTFTVDPQAGARTAVVCGQWNDWSADADVMHRDAGEGSLTVDLDADGHVRGRAAIAERHPQGALDLPVRERIIGRRRQGGPRPRPGPGGSATASARLSARTQGPNPPIPHEYPAGPRHGPLGSPELWANSGCR